MQTDQTPLARLFADWLTLERQMNTEAMPLRAFDAARARYLAVEREALGITAH